MFRVVLRANPVRIPRRNFNNGLTIKSETPTSPPANVPANYEPPQPKIEPPKAPPKINKVVSIWQTRTKWFLGGFSVASILGYMKLVDEVRQANVELKVRLQGAHADVTTLQSRLKEVEQRLANVEIHSTFDPPLKQVSFAPAETKTADV